MDDDSRLNAVDEALAHVEAPDDAVAWARAHGHDFPAAWDACPRASWLVHLAHTARMPFASVLAAATTACRYFLDSVPRDDFNLLLDIGIPIETLAGNGVADISGLHELASTQAFADEESKNLGYGDGFVEQAYDTAACMFDELEAALVTSCGRSPDEARARILAILREHTSKDEFLRAYVRCVRLGFAGLE